MAVVCARTHICREICTQTSSDGTMKEDIYDGPGYIYILVVAFEVDKGISENDWQSSTGRPVVSECGEAAMAPGYLVFVGIAS